MISGRRQFLRTLGLTAAAMTLDPERLLWVPKPMIVVPAMPAALSQFDEVLKAIYLPRICQMLNEQQVLSRLFYVDKR